MDNVIRPHFTSEATVTTEEYFGGCPECGRTSGYINSGPHHWFCCDEHQTRWYVGSNLFSSWREEKTQEEMAADARAMSYRVVKPVRIAPPTPEAQDRAADVLSLEAFDRLLAETAAESGDA